MNAFDSYPASPKSEQRVSGRVYGMECRIDLFPTLQNCEKISGVIKDESETGIGILIDEGHQIYGGMQVLIADFDGDRLGEVRHLSRVDGQILVGLFWLS